jgi:hypothetical protein
MVCRLMQLDARMQQILCIYSNRDCTEYKHKPRVIAQVSTIMVTLFAEA